jgi:hypothetical protein
MSLPVTGQSNWGVPLNDYITNAVLAVANQALTGINTHTTAIDPHGDRAYAASLVTPITTGVNLPNGYVQLNSSGVIPSALLPAASSLSNYYDAKRDFGATGNGSTDDSASLQNALNACAAAGGGEVWVGDGTYALGTQLVIGSGTWLHLSPGAIIKRIIPVAGSAPSIMLANVSFVGGTSVPAAGNILVSGGKWDAVGSGLTSNCTPIMLVQAQFSAVIQTYFNGIAGQPLIELNGSSYITVRDCVFSGAALTASGGIIPSVRLNSTSTSTTPSGMLNSVYNNTACTNVMVVACSQVNSGSQPSTNRLLGADLYASKQHSTVIVTGCATMGASYSAYPPVDFTHINEGQTFGNLWDTSAGNAMLDLTTTGSVFVGPATPTQAQPEMYVSGTISYATGYAGNVTPETPHSLSSMANGWSIGGHAQYMLNANGELVISFKDLQPGSVSDGTTIFSTGSLPPAYRTANNHRVPAYCDQLKATGGGYEGCSIELETDGSVQIYGVSSAATRVDCFAVVPIAF